MRDWPFAFAEAADAPLAGGAAWHGFRQDEQLRAHRRVRLTEMLHTPRPREMRNPP